MPEPLSLGAGGASEAIAVQQEREATRMAWLGGPEATAERLASRTAFADHTGEAAAELLQATFPEELAILNSDPARYLSDVKLVLPAGETAATISDEGEGSLLEAGMPVRTETDTGQLKKVDLSLVATGSGFETENALSDVEIPHEADEAIILGDGALEIAVSTAGAATAQQVGDKAVQYSDVLPDTDMLVAPIGDGVEIFDQLRSPASPETLRFDLGLEPGAELTLNGAGGARISIDGEVIADVSPPVAVDAQGTSVPVDLQVEGHALVLQVPHRDRDFAYPILVDPAIHENGGSWYWGANLAALNVWQYETNDPTMKWILGGTNCLTAALCSPSGRGLFVSSVNGNLPANLYGEWKYWVPGATTFIPSIYPETSAVLNPFWRNNHGCSQSTYPRPYDYNGMFNNAAEWPWWEKDRAQWYGHATMYSQAKGVGFGLNTGSGGQVPCWRSIMVGDVAIRLDDPEKPTLNAPTGVPSGWLKAGQTVSVSASASDPGLGVQNFHVFPEGALTFSYTPEQNQCPGTKVSPCPANTTANFNTSVTAFSQGISNVSLTASDPTGEKSNTQAWQLKVDRTPPTIDLNGQLAIATDEDFIAGSPKEEEEKDPNKWDELSLPVYALSVTAKDGSTTNNLAKRSGVKDIEIWLDGQEQSVSWSPQECPATSCEMTKTFELDLVDDLASGKHTLKVVAFDQLSQKETREIEFEYVPATGISDDELLRRFPLPDGKDHSGETVSQGPELAVNLLNGNLVYHQLDVDVEGTAADLEVERFYNSQLPANEDTEWGDGWTLAQTPQIDPVPAEGPPSEAVVRSATGELVRKVALPTTNGTTKFNAKLQSAVSKATGAYVIQDEADAAAASEVFNESGRLEEVEVGTYASIDYSYDSGELEEIAVDDPASSTLLPDEVDAEEGDFTPSYSMSFGSLGTGNGQFDTPGGLDMAPDGTLWVADSVNDRILHFEADGDYLGKVGSYGEGNGQFDKPVDIHVDDATGYIVVADANNDRIQVFTPAGAYFGKFGTFGSNNGQFKRPEGVAVDGKGNIWVADAGNNRVQKFNWAGQFKKAIGSAGSGEGQLYEPMGIDVGPSGNVFVADWDNNRVVVFSEEGAFVRQFGIEGEGDGELRGPVAIEVDAAGLVWVSDEKNERIEQFDQDGNYIMQFGEEGTGDGEMELANPMGIVTDNVGNIFFTDSGNDRVQRWRLGGEELPPPTYAATFGSYGTGNGQFNHPGGLDLAPDGTIWVADSQNHRIVHLKADGSYLGKFGSNGTANGQFKRPVDLEVDAAGNIYVVDTDNDRIQKFSSSGTYQSKFGTNGTGNGQFKRPEGIAIGAAGNIWVADTLNNRIQKFNSSGTFLKAVGSAGWKQGQLDEPMGIDVGPGGGVLVADWDNDRVVVFNEEGSYIRQFGIEGYGGGQFRSPVALDVDSGGYVWVSDEKNERIEQFDQGGNYLSQFGTEGSGTGQMELANPMGIVTDTSGNIYFTDSSNDRLQRWEMPDYEPPAEPEPVEDDPAVEIETPGGLVTSVEGEEAGEHSYDHSGDDLVAYDGPEGETKYQYDGNGQLTKVTLPNGTVGTVAYFADKRVKSVTVDPAGSDPAKTTGFEYSDEPRRTVVVPPDAEVMTYELGGWDIDDDAGGIFRWWDVTTTPHLVDAEGTLFAFKETEAPISIGDHNLAVETRSSQGIAEIQFIANGDLLVDEKTCEQNLEVPGIECKVVTNEWVTNTADLPPGILTLEVIVTDRIGHTETLRFWVNIPYTPPPPPGAVVPPKYAEILEFRERRGLDVDLDPVQDESELNDRIYNSIGAWHNPHTPDGAVARASQERWGVPLRPVDVAELEWRLQYSEQASEVIPSWVAANASSTFAGFYLDEEAGGKIVAGFTGAGGGATFSALEQSAGLIAGADRIVPMSPAPKNTLDALLALESQVTTAAGGYPADLIKTISVDVPSNTVQVGAANVSQAQSLLQGSFGAQAPITVHRNLTGRERKDSRQRIVGHVRAGDEIMMTYPKEEPSEKELFYGPCTSAFGAFERAKKPTTGEYVLRMFTLTAAHCAGLENPIIYRRDSKDKGATQKRFGEVRRWGFNEAQGPGIDTDAAAIRMDNGVQTPRWINQDEHLPGIKVTSVWSPTLGSSLCFSGRTSEEKRCGPVISGAEVEEEGETSTREMCFKAPIMNGDSGSPVWVEGTGVAVGIAVTGEQDPTEPGWKAEFEQELKEFNAKEELEVTPEEEAEEVAEEIERLKLAARTCFTLLKAPPGGEPGGTVFGDPDLAPLHLVTITNAQS